MGLRQALLSSAGKVNAVNLIERDALDNLLRTLRGMLWLHNRHEHLPADVAVQEVEKILNVQLSGVRSALDRSARHDWNEFDRFYADVEVLMGKADAL